MDDLTSPPSTPPQDDTSFRTKSVFTLWLITLVCLFLIVGLLGWNTLKPEPKWEYQIESVPDWDFTRKVNSLGLEGWELVFARRASSNVIDSEKPDFSYEMIFKRKAR